MIDISAGSITGDAMIDSGSPISFPDFKSASKFVAENKGILRVIPKIEQGPKYTDFEGKEIKRACFRTTTLRCGERKVPMVEFHVLQPNAPMGADIMLLVGLELTQCSRTHPRNLNSNSGRLNILSLVNVGPKRGIPSCSDAQGVQTITSYVQVSYGRS